MSSPSLREAVKFQIEKGILATGVGRFQRARLGGKTLVLAYHNVIGDSDSAEGDRPLHLRKGDFRRQLDYLARTHSVVPLQTILEPAVESGGRPRVAITFDDAYSGALIHAVPELVERGMPATIFVAPGCLSADSFWWDTLSSAEPGGLPADLRENALRQLGGEDSRIRKWALSAGLTIRPVQPVMRPATEELLRQTAELPGISLGSHTWSHLNLAAAPNDIADEEIRSSLRWLRERFPSTIPWLAYPYGSYDARTRLLAEQAGYSGGVRIDGGWVPRHSVALFDIPRLTVPAGVSIDGFALRVSGVFQT